MKITIELGQKELDILHDVVLGVTGKDLSNDDLQSVWYRFPETIKEDAIRWGLNDSVVRDNIFNYLTK